MKRFLNYLNWLLHDINRLFLYVIKFYLKIGITLLVMLAVSFPVLYFDSELAIALWGIILFFASLFIAIILIVKQEKPSSKKVINQLEADSYFWKDSVIISMKWVFYTLILFTLAAIINSFI